MHLPRALLSGLIATVTASGLAVSSSTAADRGHTRTREAMESLVERDGAPGVLAQIEDGAGAWSGVVPSHARACLRCIALDLVLVRAHVSTFIHTCRTGGRCRPPAGL